MTFTGLLKRSLSSMSIVSGFVELYDYVRTKQDYAAQFTELDRIPDNKLSERLGDTNIYKQAKLKAFKDNGNRLAEAKLIKKAIAKDITEMRSPMNGNSSLALVIASFIPVLGSLYKAYVAYKISNSLSSIQTASKLESFFKHLLFSSQVAFEDFAKGHEEERNRVINQISDAVKGEIQKDKAEEYVTSPYTLSIFESNKNSTYLPANKTEIDHDVDIKVDRSYFGYSKADKNYFGYSSKEEHVGSQETINSSIAKTKTVNTTLDTTDLDIEETELDELDEFPKEGGSFIIS